MEFAVHLYLVRTFSEFLFHCVIGKVFKANLSSFPPSVQPHTFPFHKTQNEKSDNVVSDYYNFYTADHSWKKSKYFISRE